jgi:hypothetical protein
MSKSKLNNPYIETIKYSNFPGRRFTHWITFRADEVAGPTNASKRKKRRLMIDWINQQFGPEGERWVLSTNFYPYVIRFSQSKDSLFWLLKFPNKY